MKTVTGIIFVLLLTAVSSAFCADFTECFQMNTREMGNCFYKIQVEVEKKLETECKKISLEIAESTYTPSGDVENEKKRKQVLESFQEAQKKWKSFRDTDCKFIYKDNQLGSMRSVMQLQCLILKTEERIKNLRDWRNWKY